MGLIRYRLISTTHKIINCTVKVFFNFVRGLYFNESTAFWKLDLLPSSGKKKRRGTLAFGLPG
jgi:hypothetical protein